MERILLVDDEPQVLVALADTLSDEFQTMTTQSSEQALQIVKEEDDLAVVVSDQRMPHLPGDQLFSRIREYSAARRILVTGYADLSAVVRAVNEGSIFAYVTKPWDPEDLKRKVSAAARQYRTVRDADARQVRLQREERRFRSVVDAAPNATVVVDDSGRISFVNGAAERLFGYLRGEIVGQSLDLLIPKEVRAKHAAHVASFRDGAEARPMGQRLDLRALCKDERLIPVEIGLASVELPEGRATLASIVDISQRKRYEDELRRSNTELEQFAYVASHDLQEPLRIAATYADILAARYAERLDDTGRRYLSYVVDASRKMQQLVADLLKYSTLASKEQPRVPTRVEEVVSVAKARLALALEDAGASLEVDSLPTVHTIAPRLVQVFQNLIGNSLKFRSEAPPRIRIQAERREGDWMFSVADNGIGLDMKYAERVFGMFQRLKRDDHSQGSGIGLAMVKRIVEGHGGRVWIESEPNQGTTVYFTLPLASDERDPIAPPSERNRGG